MGVEHTCGNTGMRRFPVAENLGGKKDSKGVMISPTSKVTQDEPRSCRLWGHWLKGNMTCWLHSCWFHSQTYRYVWILALINCT